MDVTWLGHSSFRIKGKYATLVTDPYAPSTGLKFPKTECDIVTISHDHQDHNDISKITGAPKIVSGPGEYEIKEVSIFGISTFHDGSNGGERGRNTVYSMTMDGINLCHLGDLGHKLSQDILGQIGQVDILFVPTGGVYTIDSERAVEIVGAIEPKVVIPMHYKVPGLSYDLEPVDAFIKEIGMEPVRTDKYSVTSDKLPEERQLVVLELKN